MGSLKSLFFALLCSLCACSHSSILDDEKPITQSTEVASPRNQSPVVDGLKKRIVVFPFINRSKYLPDRLGPYAASLLSDMLIRTKSFVLVAPKDLGVDERDYIVDGAFDRQKLLDISRGSGVNAIVLGEVEKVKATQQGDEVGLIKQQNYLMETEVHVALYDVRSGRILIERRSAGAVEESGFQLFPNDDQPKSNPFDTSKLKRALYKAFLYVVPCIQKNTSRVDWSGRIVRMEGERVYLNAGQQTGLQIGDTLKVLEEGEEVYDPQSGQLIGQSPGRVKGTIRITNFFGKDGSLAVVETGGAFREGDRIELY